MSAQVVVRDLHKRYGGVHAARGVSFEIQVGEIFGLIGPNGAGKTTTLECVVGLRVPDEGTIQVCGINARQRPRDVKQKIGAALQTTALQDKITPREALVLFGSLYRDSVAPAGLLERFSLTGKADAPYDTLSGGQRQRLALALAFVNQPEVVFLDEPTTGLDPQSRRELHAEIARMKRDGCTVLLTTHQIDEAEQLCDRIGIMDHGGIVALGTPAELVAGSSATPSVLFRTVKPLDRGLLASLPGVRDLACDDAGVRFHTADVNRTLTDLARLLDSAGAELVELHVQRATLEDVFLQITGTRLRD